MRLYNNVKQLILLVNRDVLCQSAVGAVDGLDVDSFTIPIRESIMMIRGIHVGITILYIDLGWKRH